MNKLFIITALISVSLISCSSKVEKQNGEEFQFPEKVNVQEVEFFTEINDELFFAQPNIIAPVLNGEFIVGDSKRLQLYHFDESAHLLGIYGGEGRGPGEFERISNVIVKGSTISVVDGRSSRVTSYEVKDEKLNRVKISDFQYAMMKEHPAAMFRELIANNDDSYTALYYDFNISSQKNPRVTKIVMVPYSPSFTRDTTQNSFALDFIPEFEYENGILSVPYAERGFYANINNLLIYATNNKPEVKFYNKSGEIKRVLSLPDTRKKLTSQEKEQAFMRSYKNAENPDRFRSEVLSHIPDQRSVIRGLEADADDRIWVNIFSEDSIKGDWLIFDKKGNALVSLDLPEGHTFMNAKGNRIFMRRESENGPEIVISEWE